MLFQQLTANTPIITHGHKCPNLSSTHVKYVQPIVYEHENSTQTHTLLSLVGRDLVGQKRAAKIKYLFSEVRWRGGQRREKKINWKREYESWLFKGVCDRSDSYLTSESSTRHQQEWERLLHSKVLHRQNNLLVFQRLCGRMDKAASDDRQEWWFYRMLHFA